MKKRENVSRVKILPNSVFQILWCAATKYDHDVYLEKFTSIKSKNKIDNTKYRIHIDYFYDLLEYIYKTANLSLNDILELTNLTLYQLAYITCTSPRTAEKWKVNNNLPGNLKYMILREYKILKLPHYICLESDYKNVGNRAVVDNNLISTEEYYKYKIEYEDENMTVKQLLDKLSYLDKHIKHT